MRVYFNFWRADHSITKRWRQGARCKQWGRGAEAALGCCLA